MPDSSQDINVRVTYEDAQLQSGTARSADSVKQMGAEAKKSAAHIEEVQNAADRFGGHLILYAVPGGERLAFVMERLGVASLGAAGFLAALVPVAAVVGVIALTHALDSMRDAEESASASTAEFSGKIDDAILTQEERWTGLTQGPLAQAAQKIKDFWKEENNLAAVMKTGSAQISAQTHWFGYLEQQVSNLGKALTNAASFWTGHGIVFNNFGMSDAALDAKIQKIKEADLQNGKYADGIKALAALEAQVRSEAAQGDVYAKEQLPGLTAEVTNAIKEFQEATKQHQADIKANAEKTETYLNNLKLANITGTQNAAITAQRAVTEVQRTADQESIAHARSQLDLLTQQDRQKIAALTPADQELATAKQYLAVKQQTDTNLDAEELAKNRVALMTHNAALNSIKDANEEAAVRLKATTDEANARVKLAQNEEARRQAEVDATSRIEDAKAQVTATENEGIAKKKAADLAYQDTLKANHAATLAAKQRANTTYENEKMELSSEDAETQLAQEQRLLNLQQRKIENEYELQELMAKGIKTPGETRRGGFLAAAEMRPKNEGQLKVEANAAEQAADAYQQLALKEEQAIEAQKKFISSLPAGSKDLITAKNQLVEMQETYNQDIAAYQKYVTKKEQLDRQMQVQWRQAIQAMTNDFNQGLEAWMSGHERFSVAMARAVQKMIIQFIMARVVQVEQAALGAAQVNAITRLQHMFQVTTSAKSAAATTMSTTPFPVSVPLAAAAFSSTLAFAQQGGVLGEDTMLYAHKNEMVLPPELSKFVQQAASTAAHQSEPNQVKGNINLHYSPHVNAIDTVGMADQLKQHSKLVTQMVTKQLRRGNHI